METLFYDLSEAEFSKERKILIWVLAAFFFLAGLWYLFSNMLLGMAAFSPALCVIPFGICLFITAFAAFATIKRKDHYFVVDNDKIEFRNGVFKATKRTFVWESISEISLPHKQKNATIRQKDGTSYEINLMWIEKKKATAIRKHIYYFAKEKNIPLKK